MLQLQSHLTRLTWAIWSIPIPDSVACASLEERTPDIASGKLWRRELNQGSRFFTEHVVY